MCDENKTMDAWSSHSHKSHITEIGPQRSHFGAHRNGGGECGVVSPVPVWQAPHDEVPRALVLAHHALDHLHLADAHHPLPHVRLRLARALPQAALISYAQGSDSSSDAGSE